MQDITPKKATANLSQRFGLQSNGMVAVLAACSLLA
jgi:hypothetical protein